MVVLPAPHGYDRSDKLIITLDYLQYETKSYLGVVVDLRFHLHHDHLARLGTGHQHRGVEQQLVAGLGLTLGSLSSWSAGSSGHQEYSLLAPRENLQDHG